MSVEPARKAARRNAAKNTPERPSLGTQVIDLIREVLADGAKTKRVALLLAVLLGGATLLAATTCFVLLFGASLVTASLAGAGTAATATGAGLVALKRLRRKVASKKTAMSSYANARTKRKRRI